jgi:hypothetical protein
MNDLMKCDHRLHALRSRNRRATLRLERMRVTTSMDGTTLNGAICVDSTASIDPYGVPV